MFSRHGRSLGAAMLALATTCLAGCTHPGEVGGHTVAGPTAPGTSIGTVMDVQIPDRIRDLPLTTTRGTTLRLRDLTGRVVVLSDAMTLCQETCPLDTATLVDIARHERRSVHQDDTVFLSVTVDPARDTPAQLAAYRKLFTPPPSNWLVLTGSPATVGTLWDYLGVWRHKVPTMPGAKAPHDWRTGEALHYDVEHSDELFFIGQQGHERFVLEGPPYAARRSIPLPLYRFLDKSGHANLSSPDPAAWTSTQALQVLAWLQH